MVAIQPSVPPIPLEENEVGIDCESEKEMGETTLKSNIQGDFPIENLTLVEENESGQGDENQKVVTNENYNMFQPKASILGCNGLQSSKKEGEKLNIVRPQLQMVKFIEPQPKAKIGQPSALRGHEGKAKVTARSHPGCTSHPNTSTHHQQNGKIRVENKKVSKLGVKHGWPSP
ncbi:hypothetical protein L3X38_036981 [Prunus dulcis]|uniref:Uncharacterized protein n=1 Tax=Prunus dulcis TaxID=3755 RepID=A0AAD4YQ86_PRUDU|nr:hypothetical protein L3X38_036981 [Prunus dulcis]